MRALHEVGATVIGIGERPKDWLGDDVKGWLTHYEQVPSVVDEERLDRRRALGAGPGVGRPSGGDDRSPRDGRRPRPRGLRHPRHVGAHDLPVPRQAGDEGGAACRRRAVRPLGRTAQRPRRARLRRRRRLPDHPQAGRRCRRIGRRAGQLARRARRGDRPQRRRPWGRGRRRGVRRRPRGVLRHDRHRWPRRRRLRHPLLPQRARGDAHTLDLAAVRHDQPHRLPRLRRAARARPAGHHRPRHRHVGDAHGVVRRVEGVCTSPRSAPARQACGPGTSTPPPTTSTSTASGPTPSSTVDSAARRRDSSPPG